MSDRTLMDCAQAALMYSEDDARVIADAAEEITRLRARVEVLEAALHAIFPDGADIKIVPKQSANAEEAKP